jgi:hypothetical protein
MILSPKVVRRLIMVLIVLTILYIALWYYPSTSNWARNNFGYAISAAAALIIFIILFKRIIPPKRPDGPHDPSFEEGWFRSEDWEKGTRPFMDHKDKSQKTEGWGGKRKHRK